ncbi:MAG: winged helix-turn-helix domain-containing protein [Fervidicoccaceae archaeon]
MQAEKLGITALRIYAKLLEAGEMGVRELARELGVSASSVHYHLKRLEELGLVARGREGYTVSRLIPIEGYVLLKRRLVPRLMIYSFFFLGIAVGEAAALAARGSLDSDGVVALFSAITASVVLMIEGTRASKLTSRGSGSGRGERLNNR